MFSRTHSGQPARISFRLNRMRAAYFFFFIVSVVLLVSVLGLVVVRIVNGPTNILFPGFGLVVSLELIIIVFLILDAIAFGLAMVLRSTRGD